VIPLHVFSSYRRDKLIVTEVNGIIAMFVILPET